MSEDKQTKTQGQIDEGQLDKVAGGAGATWADAAKSLEDVKQATLTVTSAFGGGKAQVKASPEALKPGAGLPSGKKK